MLVGMITARALLGRSLAFVDISANEAKPFDRLLTLPHGASIDEFQTVLETVMM